jgi:glycosyltransferase involved in cell wall biosynthesis
MIRTSPQIPYPLKSVGYTLGYKMLKDNISCSKKVTYITNSLKEDYKLPNSKAEYIPNGVDTELFNEFHVEMLKSSLNLDGDFVIGYVGALREWVDLEPIFKAMSLFDPNIHLKFLLVGAEGGLQRNKILAEKYVVSEKVIFTGTIPYYQIPKYVSCMDLCLIPFKKDAVAKNSLPLKLFEYMACKRPVISTRLPGVVDAVGDRILYASDYREFYEKIICLYDSDSSRRLMGTEGRDFVVNNYEWSVICGKLNRVLEESAA